MGHSTILMTMRYAHLAPDQLRTFVDLGVAPTGQKTGKRSAGTDAADEKSAALN
jgi:hypothetical protein